MHKTKSHYCNDKAFVFPGNSSKKEIKKHISHKSFFMIWFMNLYGHICRKKKDCCYVLIVEEWVEAFFAVISERSESGRMSFLSVWALAKLIHESMLYIWFFFYSSRKNRIVLLEKILKITQNGQKNLYNKIFWVFRALQDTKAYQKCF